MIIRVFVFLAFIFSVSGGNAESIESSSADDRSVEVNQEVEAAFESFSKAVSEENVQSFIKLADPNGIHLVRKFTSGTLGGRGSELSELTDPKKMNENFEFPIKNQTPYGISIQFQELPIKSVKALSNRPLSAEVETLDFDTWGPFLKQSLIGTPESADRLPIMLSSANSKYYVYAEAQIIDDILVGGFAVFEKKDGKLQLVSLIELL